MTSQIHFLYMYYNSYGRYNFWRELNFCVFMNLRIYTKLMKSLQIKCVLQSLSIYQCNKLIMDSLYFKKYI